MTLPSTMLTLAQAAEATGLNRSTILRAVKSGKISGSKDEFQTWHVQPEELFRVFPAQSSPVQVPQHAQGDVELRVRLAQAEAQLDALKGIVNDLRAQRDSWQAQAERLAITAQATPKAVPSVPTVVVQRRSWWRRFAG